MKRAFFIALAVHLGILLVGGYIYVLPPGQREKVFRALLHSEKIMPMKKIRTAPKRVKKAPTVRPIRRTKSIELIGVRRGVASGFTVPVPEISRGVYTPGIALVSIPEPTVSKGLGDFWGTRLTLRKRQMGFESFGVGGLKPLGSIENPVTQLQFRFVSATSQLTDASQQDLGIMFPGRRLLIRKGERPGKSITIGPYAVPPEQFVFYAIGSGDAAGRLLLSTDPNHCRRRNVGTNSIMYTWEATSSGGGGGDWNDIIFIVTFLGAQGM